MKNILKILLAAAVLLGLAILAYERAQAPDLTTPADSAPSSSITPYFDDSISFAYKSGPDGYTLSVKGDELQEYQEFIKSIVLMNTREYEELLKSDFPRSGPPAISITILESGAETSPRAWVQGNPFWSLLGTRGSEMTEITVDGIRAVQYQADGLYPSDMIAVIHEGRAYLMSGSYNDPSDAMRDDFNSLVDSVRFAGAETGSDE